MTSIRRFLVMLMLLSAQACSRDPESPIRVTRTVPDDKGLRGSPGSAVSVAIAIENQSSEPVELSPIRMSCSCQVIKAHELNLLPGQKTEATVTLHYPAFGTQETPITIRDRDDRVIGGIHIALEADQTPPFFLRCPENFEVLFIQGTEERGWDSSIITIENNGSSPLVKDVEVFEGAEYMTVKMDSEFVPQGNSSTGRRTYRLHFQLTNQALDVMKLHPVLHGVTQLTLQDKSSRNIHWTAKAVSPIALFIDPVRGTVTGVRRSGSQGEVQLRLVPEGSGRLFPDHFGPDEPISSKLESSGTASPREIVAVFQGSTALVESVTAVPRLKEALP